MTIVFVRRLKSLRMAPKKYLVCGMGCSTASTDQLDEAKQIGKCMADRAVMRGGWRVPFITISILVADPPGSSHFVRTGLRMFVPVRGTGILYKDIVARIRKHHGVKPLTWTSN